MNEMDLSTVDTYFRFLKDLNDDEKRELIARLSDSLAQPQVSSKQPLSALFGAFISDQSADEMISDLRQSRSINHQIKK
jgi:hypothetical protein